MTPEICRFALVVTGRGEEKFLPRLFRGLMARANCLFTVLRRIGQRSPITSPTRLLRMVGSGRRLPTKDEEDIGLPALRFLRKHPRGYVIVVDDLEGARRAIAAEVFARYRTALDEVLGPPGLQARAAVHFLVNMLEAYYFADHGAVNVVAGRNVIAKDHPADVEEIGHPKAALKRLWPEFDEIAHGDAILGRLCTAHVLSRPRECCWLRAMFAWCVVKLVESDAVHDPGLTAMFSLADGDRAPVPSRQ
jgi:hypothetical protein